VHPSLKVRSGVLCEVSIALERGSGDSKEVTLTHGSTRCSEFEPRLPLTRIDIVPAGARHGIRCMRGSIACVREVR
jgi:hypothetical protein